MGCKTNSVLPVKSWLHERPDNVVVAEATLRAGPPINSCICHHKHEAFFPSGMHYRYCTSSDGFLLVYARQSSTKSMRIHSDLCGKYHREFISPWVARGLRMIPYVSDEL